MTRGARSHVREQRSDGRGPRELREARTAWMAAKIPADSSDTRASVGTYRQRVGPARFVTPVSEHAWSITDLRAPTKPFSRVLIRQPPPGRAANFRRLLIRSTGRPPTRSHRSRPCAVDMLRSGWRLADGRPGAVNGRRTSPERTRPALSRTERCCETLGPVRSSRRPRSVAEVGESSQVRVSASLTEADAPRAAWLDVAGRGMARRGLLGGCRGCLAQFNERRPAGSAELDHPQAGSGTHCPLHSAPHSVPQSQQ